MKSIFSLHGRPWLLTFLIMVSWVIFNILIAILLIILFQVKDYSQISIPWAPFLAHILTIFVMVPFLLGFPGKQHTYGDYLSEIRLTKVQPLLKLVLLGLSCYLILALSQAAGVFVYRLTQGLPIDWSFIRNSFVLANELPPRSTSWLQSLPSIPEEITWRGVVLAAFLRVYDQRKAILFSALCFGLLHSVILFEGNSVVWTAGEVLWAAILGIFYGYVTIKTNSLLPAMIVHYLGNLLISAINAYIQNTAPVLAQAVYGVVFTLGIIPTMMMILWTRFFTTWWPMIQKSQGD